MNKIMKIINDSNNIKKSNFFIDPKNVSKVKSILLNVKQNGDTALQKYEKKFGNIDIVDFKIYASDVEQAYSKVSKQQIKTIKFIRNRLISTEKTLRNQFQNTIINHDGIKITKSFVPINNVGCYVPGGLAKYTSSLLMSVVPAKVAGVKRVVVVSPTNNEGLIDPLTLVSADICGVDEFYKLGGAQAIAALAYGTETIKSVDKIVGPGGAFVTIAKSLISNNISIDMIAGPTELGIIADYTSDVNFVASDIISQAEHDVNTTCFVATTSVDVANMISKKIDEKIKHVKRNNIIKSSLRKNGFIMVCKTQQRMIDLINDLSPEHLEIITKKPNLIASKIHSAGIILMGKYAPSSASDYAFGSNHILPTNTFGKTRGSLSVLDFMKLDTKIQSTKSSLKKILNHVYIMTCTENLPNHYDAIRERLL